MEYEIKRSNLVIDNEMIEDIIDTAGYGINYWAHFGKVDSEAQTYTVKFAGDDFEDSSPFTSGIAVLTYKQIAETVERVLQGGFVNDTMTKDLDDSIVGGEIDVDAELGDVIIQMAIFGDVVYG